jgi:hypothetical protein
VENFCILSMYKQTIYCKTWPRSFGSWNYNCLCNQCLSPLMLRVRISIRARCTILCDKVFQWLERGPWFSPGLPVSSTNKTDRHDITEILLKVALHIIKQTNKQTNTQYCKTIDKKETQIAYTIPLIAVYSYLLNHGEGILIVRPQY